MAESKKNNPLVKWFADTFGITEKLEKQYDSEMGALISDFNANLQATSEDDNLSFNEQEEQVLDTKLQEIWNKANEGFEMVGDDTKVAELETIRQAYAENVAEYGAEYAIGKALQETQTMMSSGAVSGDKFPQISSAVGELSASRSILENAASDNFQNIIATELTSIESNISRLIAGEEGLDPALVNAIIASKVEGLAQRPELQKVPDLQDKFQTLATIVKDAETGKDTKQYVASLASKLQDFNLDNVGGVELSDDLKQATNSIQGTLEGYIKQEVQSDFVSVLQSINDGLKAEDQTKAIDEILDKLDGMANFIGETDMDLAAQIAQVTVKLSEYSVGKVEKGEQPEISEFLLENKDALVGEGGKGLLSAIEDEEKRAEISALMGNIEGEVKDKALDNIIQKIIDIVINFIGSDKSIGDNLKDTVGKIKSEVIAPNRDQMATILEGGFRDRLASLGISGGQKEAADGRIYSAGDAPKDADKVKEGHEVGQGTERKVG